MRARWRALAGRIDALSLRERALVFVAAIAAVVFLGSALFIEPAAARKRALLAQMTRQTADLQTMQAQIADLDRKRADPDAANTTRRDRLRADIAALDESLREVSASLVPAQKMRALLQDVLARSPRLRLVGLRTLPATPLVDKPAAAENNAGAAAAAPVTGSVFKHGVEIRLQGSYADLHDYLARLERLEWRMFWAVAALDARDHPQLTLSVTLYTLSPDKAWLVL